MDDLQCADFEAEAAILKRIAIGFPVYFESLREKHIDADRDVLESRTGASHHPYDGGRMSGGLIWLSENLLEWRDGIERQIAWETGDFCVRRDGDVLTPSKSPWDEMDFLESVSKCGVSSDFASPVRLAWKSKQGIWLIFVGQLGGGEVGPEFFELASKLY